LSQSLFVEDRVELEYSRTATNLRKSFAGESEARNRYTFAASVARKEELEHVAAVFLETAENEEEHAKLFFRHLALVAPSTLEITASYPVVAGDAAAQLKAAFEGEKEEWSLTGIRPDRPGGGVPGSRPLLRADRQGRERARGSLSPLIRSHGQRNGLQAGRKELLALRQLRLHPRRRHGLQALSRLRAPARILRACRGEILIHPVAR
jgi:hypothetical protein